MVASGRQLLATSSAPRAARRRDAAEKATGTPERRDAGETPEERRLGARASHADGASAESEPPAFSLLYGAQLWRLLLFGGGLSVTCPGTGTHSTTSRGSYTSRRTSRRTKPSTILAERRASARSTPCAGLARRSRYAATASWELGSPRSRDASRRQRGLSNAVRRRPQRGRSSWRF